MSTGVAETLAIDVAALDWQPPCECNWHRDGDEAAAAWIVFRAPCCPEKPRVVFWCNYCLQAVMADHRGCIYACCGATFRPVRRAIERAEPLTPPRPIRTRTDP